MNYLALSGLLIFISSVLSVGLVLFKAKKNEVSITWCLFSFFVSLWGLGLYKAFSTDIYSASLFWSRFLNLSAVFIPIFFLHFVLSFTEKAKGKFKELVFYYCIILSFFVVNIIFPKLFVAFVEQKYDFKYYPSPGILYYFFPILFGYFVVYGIIILFKEMLTTSPIRKNQIKYLLAGIAIGFMGGSTTFFYVFNIKIPPAGTFLTIAYVVTISIAVIKYRMMDINIAIKNTVTNTLLLTVVSGLTITIYFLPANDVSKIICFLLIGILTVVYLPKIKTKTESVITQILYKNKYKYQEKLRAVARSIPEIYDMEKLLKTLDNISIALDCSPCSFMLLDDITKRYSIAHSVGLSEKIKKGLEFSPEIEFVQKLKWGGRPVVKEELLEDDMMRERMELIKAEVSVPIIRKDKLLGVINLNHKASGDVYSSEDLSVLIDIAEFLGMAIENITLNKKAHHQDLITYLNNIAYAMSHELKNKSQSTLTTAQSILNALPGITNVPSDLIKLATISAEKVAEIDKIVNEMVSYSNIQQMQGFGELDLAKTLNDSLRVTGQELEAKKIKIVKDYKESKISHGDWGQLLQAFVNIIKNAVESMGENGTLTLKIMDKTDLWEVSVADNGKGIPKNHLDSIFEPFFTTKFENTGLGLSIARRIIYDHTGVIEAESEEGKGTTINIYLPKQMPEEKIKARAEIKRREDITYDKIKTKDAREKAEKENNNG